MDAKRRWQIWGTLLAGTVAAALYPTQEPTAAASADAIVRSSIPARPAGSHTQAMPPSPIVGTSPPAAKPGGDGAAQPAPAIADPFAPVAWDAPPKPTPLPAPPPIPVAVAPPAEPQEPPIPYRFLGRMQEDGGKPVIYLARGQDSVVVHVGDTFDTQYKLVSADEHKLVIEYLPLNRQHDLPIDAP